MRWFLLISLVATLASAKIFEKCELANVLETKHNMPRDQVKSWVCIAQYESTFNTEAINKFNWDGSRDYGLFQLNNKYWCKDEDENPAFQNVCRMPCSNLLNADLTDDLACIKKIIRETEAWKGKGTGLTSWVAYVSKCQNRNLEEYMSECWAEDNFIGIRDDEEEPEDNAINVRDEETPEETDQLVEAIVNNARIPLVGPLLHAFPFLGAQHPILRGQHHLLGSHVHHIIPQPLMHMLHYQPQQLPLVQTNPFGFVYRRI